MLGKALLAVAGSPKEVRLHEHIYARSHLLLGPHVGTACTISAATVIPKPKQAMLTRIASALKLMTPEEFTSEPVSSAIAFASSVSDPYRSGYAEKNNGYSVTQINVHTIQSVSIIHAPPHVATPALHSVETLALSFGERKHAFLAS